MPDRDWRAIGRAFSDLRKRFTPRLSRAKLGRLAHLDAKTVERLESGIGISEHSFQALCSVVGVRFEDSEPVQITQTDAPKSAPAHHPLRAPGATDNTPEESAIRLETMPPQKGRYRTGPRLGTAAAETIDSGGTFVFDAGVDVGTLEATKRFWFKMRDDSLEPMAWKNWRVICTTEEPADGDPAIVDVGEEGATRLEFRKALVAGGRWTLRDPRGRLPDFCPNKKPRHIYRVVGTLAPDQESEE